MTHEEEKRAARLNAFFEFERQLDLFATRVDGWSAWRVLRNPVYLAVGRWPLTHPGRPTAVRVFEALRASLKLAWLLIVPPRRELLVKTCRSALRMRRGDKYRDVYFDGLLERGHSCLKLEEINSPDFDRQAAAALRPADLDPVVFTFWGGVLGRLFPVNVGEFCAYLAGKLRDEVQASLEPSWLRLRLSTVYWQIRLYRLLLARIRPAAVLVADTGEYALRIAAFRERIPFVELQHGIFDAAHPDAVPAWVKGSPIELALPDVLACRGQYWIDKLTGTRQGRDHAVAVGSELIDIARQQKIGRRTDGALTIVLTTQGLDTVRLIEWVRQMIAAAPVDRDWRLLIKLHPVYDVYTRAFDSLKDQPRLTVVGGSDSPNIFELLTEAHLHLSIASACHFDAAALGIPTVIVPLAGHETLVDAVDGKQIFLAREPKEVWEIVDATPTGHAQQSRFSTPDFIDNLECLLENLWARRPSNFGLTASIVNSDFAQASDV